MGSLAVPPSGLVYIDAQSLIYTVEVHPRYHPVLRPLWASVAAGAVGLVTSELTVLEALVVPYRTANATLEAEYERLFGSNILRVEPVTSALLRAAARLRATTRRLRTPDAIHAATAVRVSADLFVTNDFGFRSVPGLTVAVLDDVLAAP